MLNRVVQFYGRKWRVYRNWGYWSFKSGRDHVRCSRLKRGMYLIQHFSRTGAAL